MTCICFLFFSSVYLHFCGSLCAYTNCHKYLCNHIFVFLDLKVNDRIIIQDEWFLIATDMARYAWRHNLCQNFRKWWILIIIICLTIRTYTLYLGWYIHNVSVLLSDLLQASFFYYISCYSDQHALSCLIHSQCLGFTLRSSSGAVFLLYTLVFGPTCASMLIQS